MKRLYGLILTVLLVLLAAAALADSGEFGGGTWTLDAQGVLTFTGPADLTEWRTNGTEFQNVLTKVIYGPEVTGVRPSSYSYAYNLKAFEVDPANPVCRSVDGILYSKDMTELIEAPTGKTGSYTIPEGVRVIRNSAFTGSYLSELILPESLEEIEDQAFWDAEFRSLHIPAATCTIAGSALNLHAIEAFTVAEGNPSFSASNGVLFNHDGTTLIHYPVAVSAEEYTVPQGVTTIGYNSFVFAEFLKKLTLPEGVSSIGTAAFNYCSALEEISLPSTLELIDSGVFRTTRSLKTVRYAGTMEGWNAVVVGDDNAMLRACTIVCADGNVEPEPAEGSIGDGITYVLDYKTGTLTVSGAGEWDDYAFDENMAIVKAVLQEGVTEIGLRGFGYCRSLTEVTIPSTVTRIRDEAFTNCSALTSLTIPATVTSLGNDVFTSCNALTEITYGGTMDAWEALRAGTSDWGLDRIDIICTDGTIEGLGGGPGPEEPGLQVYPVFDCYYVAEGAGFDIIQNSLSMEPQIGFGFASYTEEMLEQEPEGPQWTLQLLEGTAEAEITTDPEWSIYFCQIILRRPPAAPETDIWHVTCTWAGETFETEFELEFRDVPTLPTGVEPVGAGPWTVQVGDIVNAAGRYRFVNGWHLAGETADSVLYGFEPPSAIEFSMDDEGMRVLTAVEPGTCSCEILMTCANLRWLYPSQLIITEAGGEAPKPCGADGDNVTWTLDANGRLVLTGTGAIADFDPGDQPWTPVADRIRTVVIGDGITEIGCYDFFGCDQIRRVEMADSVVTIGDCAFQECTALAELRLSSALEEIGSSAFMECSSLSSVTLPASLRDIGWCAFASCNLSSVSLPSGADADTWDFFYEEENRDLHLYHIDLPAGVTGVSEGAFYDNPLPHDLPDFVLPSGLTVIEAEAFSGINPRFVWLPEGVTAMEDAAFVDCTRLEYIYIPQGCESFGENILPSGVTILGIGGYDEYRTEAQNYAEENGHRFILLENPYSGNG